MAKIKTLEAYTNAMLAIADFAKKHYKIFDEYNSLKVAAQEAEEALKADVKENHKMNIANDFIRVSYSPAFKKGYRADIILSSVSPKVKKELMDMGAILTKEEVDAKKLEEAVEKGIVPVEVRQKAYEEKELAPRVSIKEIGHEQEND